VTAVDFCYGWTLWLFLSWIPSFFYQNYQQNLMQSAFYSAGVFLAGVIGDTLGGVVSDQILHRTGNRAAARRNVIVAGMLGGFVFLIPVMLVHDVNVAAISLAAAFFSVELVVAPIWAVPMDIAPKYSGSASGMMNFGFGLAGIISPIVFGYLIDRTGSWTLPFAGSICLLLLGAGLAFRMHPDRPFAEPRSRPPVLLQRRAHLALHLQAFAVDGYRLFTIGILEIGHHHFEFRVRQIPQLLVVPLAVSRLQRQPLLFAWLQAALEDSNESLLDPGNRPVGAGQRAAEVDPRNRDLACIVDRELDHRLLDKAASSPIIARRFHFDRAQHLAGILHPCVGLCDFGVQFDRQVLDHRGSTSAIDPWPQPGKDDPRICEGRPGDPIVEQLPVDLRRAFEQQVFQGNIQAAHVVVAQPRLYGIRTPLIGVPTRRIKSRLEDTSAKQEKTQDRQARPFHGHFRKLIAEIRGADNKF
jgi:hypothetical protein